MGRCGFILGRGAGVDAAAARAGRADDGDHVQYGYAVRCGRRLPADAANAVRRSDSLSMRPILRLTEKQRQLYALIVERPRDAGQLFALAYWLHPQDADVSVIKAHINQINRKLCYRGQRIIAERGEPYRIVRI